MYGRILCHIKIHENKMTDAAAHDEEMKNLMGAKILVFCVKKREF